jgi:hypothetical protein
VLTTGALQVLQEIQQLLLQFAKSSEGGVMKRMLHFLNAQGFRQQFEEQEQELRDCLLQLSAVLNAVQVTSQVRSAAAADARPHSSHNVVPWSKPSILCSPLQSAGDRCSWIGFPRLH